jgi:DNA helicase-2/ATP-dependent DNA helicase PcrA
MTPPLLADLNDEQLAAVTLPHESALILAGAGSGKTRVLTTRIAWLLASGQATPYSILAVTFTNKAAREMLLRLSTLTPATTRGMWIGTFHGLCNRMLRAHYRDAGLPQLFQILDTQDQLGLIKRLYRAHGLDDERYPPRDLQWFIADAKERGLRPNAVEAGDSIARTKVEHYALYEAMCEREGVVDFAELLLRSVELLAGSEAIRTHYQRRFSDLLVDEFQDTNVLQYRWLRLLAGPDAAVFAVGDDDQSIYAFRGANVANMRHLERDFARGGVPVRLIKLERNYRSHGHILDAANALIRNNASRLGKNLWTSEGKGEPVRAFVAGTDLDEAAFIVDVVQGLAGEGLALDEIALLYRSNAQSRVLEHALFNAAIPYRVYGGTRFFERAEVKNALAYLRLLATPGDDGAFLRAVNFPPRGIGARSLELLQDAARERGSSLWQAACEGAVKGRTGTALASFIGMIEGAREATRALPLGETVEHVIEISGLAAHYRNERDGEERVENLAELVSAAEAFTREADLAVDADGGATDPLTAFLAHAALEAGDTQEAEGRAALQLMTMHAAKGLEFHTVFVTGLEEGLFPHENSRNEPAGLEEERRLMYVAVTRARRRLYLTLAQTRMLHGQTRYSLPSRFVDELPRELVQWLSPKRARASHDVDFGARPLRPESPRHAVGSSEGRPRRPAAGSAAAALPGWRIGETVRHVKFGLGIIIDSEGQGSDARVQVNFREAGVKWLALDFAHLERA